MSDSVWAILGIVGWFAIPTLFAWMILEGLRKGVVRARNGSYSKVEEPIYFWLCICMYAALIAWYVYLSVRMALDI
ncbi:hypothetical protein ACFOON_08575 [Novosphingobium piscinae]|uniref:Uncharacterized protein n=1 Tax=Novosphingobium piscinae TaxID=1507448 RepID=A0A7X1KQ03_9SPHN|nr:hypothetical protein [Novosphingobium piscinae]MBC2669013.1 hypothetical protein [Novosphingobium piscinae]